MVSGNITAILNNKNKFSYNLKSTSKNEKITHLNIENPEPFIKNYIGAISIVTMILSVAAVPRVYSYQAADDNISNLSQIGQEQVNGVNILCVLIVNQSAKFITLVGQDYNALNVKN